MASQNTAVTRQLKGWPSYLAHGGYAGAGEPQGGSVQTVDALFRYSGLDSTGDSGKAVDPREWLNPFAARIRAVQKAQGRPAVAVLAHHTAFLSGDDPGDDLTDRAKLRTHYLNLIWEAQLTQTHIDQGDITFSYILNPDFLGELQHSRETPKISRLFTSGSIPVAETVEWALNQLNEKNRLEVHNQLLTAKGIPQFASDIRGYIQSLNWVLRTIAPDVTFGWQVNPWAVGGGQWVHGNTDPAEVAKEVSAFISDIGAYQGEWAGDFIAFDRYEADDFSTTAVMNSYAWAGDQWSRYLDYVGAVSTTLRRPAMLWQIPGGHLPTTQDGDETVTAGRAGSGGTFFLGDPRIGTDLDKISKALLELPIDRPWYQATNVRDLLKSDFRHDWGQSHLAQARDSNVFAILWGGGSSTILPTATDGTGNWLAERVNNYRKQPLTLS
ncbi:hypothetical protein ACFWNG_05550 [Streptomyces sp. NPDC058391]|uniref:hypothetical protein n=1 Tax=Streptomyces sp. NPDC058391 TaxID=3346476 RepID=UPI0036654677